MVVDIEIYEPRMQRGELAIGYPDGSPGGIVIIGEDDSEERIASLKGTYAKKLMCER